MKLRPTLPKTERLCSRKAIDALFESHQSHSMAVFPLRMVWMETEAKGVQAQMMVSAPKRHLRHAVDRNRVKRQVREAYRQAKIPMLERLAQTPDKAVAIAFVWLANEVAPTERVESSVQRLMQRLLEKL